MAEVLAQAAPRRARHRLLVLCLVVSGCVDEASSDSERFRAKNPFPLPVTVGSEWHVALSDLPGALASVWGTSERDVWLAGSDAHDGLGPLVLHLEAGEWVRKRTGSVGDLWWAHGFARGPVFFGGSEGKVLRYENGRFRAVPAPRTRGTVYGVWGADAADVWAVGGDPTFGTGAFVWRGARDRFEAVALPVRRDDVIAYFKVWGTSRSDVWIVGTPGISLHWDGTSLERVDPGTSEPLFTVHASASGSSYAAVGGSDLGVLIERTAGGAWSPAPLPSGTRLLAGVWLTETGGYAVGAEGTVLSRATSGWVDAATGIRTTKALHSVWVDPTGDVWTVGGDILFPPFGAGLLIHRGVALPHTYSVEGGSLDAGDAARHDADAHDAQQDADHEDVSVDVHEASLGADAHDAEADRSAGHEAGDATSSPGFVRCGASTCSLPDERCCAAASTGVPVGCVAASVACPSGQAPVSCDEPSDCGVARACCLNRYQQAGDLVNVECEPSCRGPSVCKTDVDCGGAACTTFSIMKSYTTCPPP